MQIGGIEIGQGQPCRFVAEVSGNHNGDFARALRLIEAAKDCGADFVKMQCYTPDELVALRGDGPAPEPWGSDGWTMRRLYEKAQTPLAWFPKLFQHARDIGVVPFSSVFGKESLVALESVKCPAYKIARLDNQHIMLIAAATATGKPVMVSVSAWLGLPYGNSFARLYCPPGYPTLMADVHLPQEWRFDGDYLGISSHCLASSLPVAAVARGAKLLEYHMMLAEEPSELESAVSLTEHQFKQMIRDVRECELLLA